MTADVSTYTSRNRFDLPGQGSYPNLWGTQHVNPDLARVDDALDGWVRVDASAAASYALAVSQTVAADEARCRVLLVTGTPAAPPFTLTVPLVQKWYHVINATGAVMAVAAGAATLDVPPGTFAVLCDGTSLYLADTGTPGETVVPVTSLSFQPTAAHDGKVLVCVGAYALDLGAFAAAARNGAALRVRAYGSSVTVAYVDPYRGPVTERLGPYSYAAYATVGGQVVRVSGSPEVF